MAKRVAVELMVNLAVYCRGTSANQFVNRWKGTNCIELFFAPTVNPRHCVAARSLKSRECYGIDCVSVGCKELVLGKRMRMGTVSRHAVVT